MKKKVWKSLLALALGGGISGAATVTITEDIGGSLKKAGVMALVGAGTALAGLHTRAPREDDDQ